MYQMAGKSVIFFNSCISKSRWFLFASFIISFWTFFAFKYIKIEYSFYISSLCLALSTIFFAIAIKELINIKTKKIDSFITNKEFDFLERFFNAAGRTVPIFKKYMEHADPFIIKEEDNLYDEKWKIKAEIMENKRRKAAIYLTLSLAIINISCIFLSFLNTYNHLFLFNKINI